MADRRTRPAGGENPAYRHRRGRGRARPPGDGNGLTDLPDRDFGTPPTQAAQAATTTIPMVMIGIGDAIPHSHLAPRKCDLIPILRLGDLRLPNRGARWT